MIGIALALTLSLSPDLDLSGEWTGRLTNHSAGKTQRAETKVTLTQAGDRLEGDWHTSKAGGKLALTLKTDKKGRTKIAGTLTFDSASTDPKVRCRSSFRMGGQATGNTLTIRAGGLLEAAGCEPLDWIALELTKH